MISTRGHYVRQDPDRISDQHGLSANVVRRAAQNARHLVDQYAQTRINAIVREPRYYSPTPQENGSDIDNIEALAFSQVVPWRVRPDDLLFQPVLRVGIDRDGSAPALVIATLAPVTARSDLLTTLRGALSFWSVQVEASSDGWVIDEVGQYGAGANPLNIDRSLEAAELSTRRYVSAGADGNGAPVDVVLMRLTVHIAPGSPTAVTGVYLREYAGAPT